MDRIQTVTIAKVDGGFPFTIGGGIDAPLLPYDEGILVVNAEADVPVKAGDKVIEICGVCVVGVEAAFAANLVSHALVNGSVELLVLQGNTLFNDDSEVELPTMPAMSVMPSMPEETEVRSIAEEFSMDTIETVTVQNRNGDFGFTIAGGTDAPLHPYDEGIFILETHADVDLKAGDKVLRINQFSVVGVEESYAFNLWADSFADESIELVILRQNSLFREVGKVAEVPTRRARKAQPAASNKRRRRNRCLVRWNADSPGPDASLASCHGWSAEEMFAVNLLRFGIRSSAFNISEYCSA